MGQYYLIANIDKKEFIYPHKFGDGLKLLEFGADGCGTMTGLAILLADGNNRSGGDLQSNHEIIGSWAGDRIVVAGDYADEGKFTDDPTINLFDYAQEHYKDVSDAVITAMCDNGMLKEALKEKPFAKKLRPDVVFQ
jgi:hypothetical protein